MGDPLHAKPVVVAYGKTAGGPGAQDRIIYAATNDGLLHAIEAQTGVERWAFLAPEYLKDQVILHANPASPTRHYGIDGNIRAYVHADADGVIEYGQGERVYLFFGMRRGGSSYYGLDVTRPDSPRVLWRTDASALPGLGQSWSTPAPARIEIEGTRQNDRLLVLVFGGGYDPTQDRLQASTDQKGNAIFIIDALNGELLWHASRSGSNFDTANMAYSIPADVRVLDLDANGFADRLYAADMGGQVWRFDVFNGQPAASLIHGGVLARLGDAPLLLCCGRCSGKQPQPPVHPYRYRLGAPGAAQQPRQPRPLLRPGAIMPFSGRSSIANIKQRLPSGEPSLPRSAF